MDEPKPKTTMEQTIEAEMMDLLTGLFNANQRLAFAEKELETAKENRKTCQAEVDRYHLLINDAVPRIRERLMVRGSLEQELPPIVKWREDLDKGLDPGAQIVGGPNDGEKPTADQEIDMDDLTGTVISFAKGLRFGRFEAKRAKEGANGDEWDLECKDCASVFARVRVAKDEESIVELRRSAKVHLDIFHPAKDGGFGLPPMQ